MSNLIPVRRLDKNGVMTTKWVTPPSQAPATASSIPAPSLSPSTSTPKIFAPKYREEVDLVDTEVSSLYRKSMIRHSRPLESFDVRSLQAVEYMVHSAIAGGLSYQADTEVGSAFNIVYSQIAKGAKSGEYTAFNNLAVFGDAVIRPDSENLDVQALVAGIDGISNVKDYLEVPEEVREQAIVLVTAAARLNQPFVMINGDYYDDERTIRIASPYLQDFILSRPDDVEAIAKIVNERETDDVNVVREVLDHGQQTLREGVL